jgi:hypothetical protein
VKQVFSSESRKRLRPAWILLAASVALSATLVGGPQAYLENERRDAAGSDRRMQEARARVKNLRRERESLEQSAGVFSTLLVRGLMRSERRLDFVERLNAMRVENRILSVDYEISPQRALVPSGNPSFPAVDILASRVSLKARALHEGDVIDFIRALGNTPQGFHPVQRCHFKRIDGPAGLQQARIEADCTLEWITMKEKGIG